MPTLPPRRKTILPCPALPPLFQRPSAKGLPTIVPPASCVLNFAWRMKSLSPDKSQWDFEIMFVYDTSTISPTMSGAISPFATPLLTLWPIDLPMTMLVSGLSRTGCKPLLQGVSILSTKSWYWLPSSLTNFKATSCQFPSFTCLSQAK